ncbi:hypothetical protein GTU79_05710 [Sodalis ligni]|uniref:hypothetical protein n=1 Tax=Sodalis ligni TaxID=2697027 RepID=UPI001BDF6CBC|nr:hypothetical protein [Sodalis ligni]QWA12251.1 hypothetical protein GTU79_05710 [Sodalis ligni]
MYTYKNLVEQVIAENKTTLLAVDENEISQLMDEICKAKTIQLYAMGRMQLSVRAFAMRLKHMGFDSYVVYDTTTPCIGEGTCLSSTAGSPMSNSISSNWLRKPAPASLCSPRIRKTNMAVMPI